MEFKSHLYSSLSGENTKNKRTNTTPTKDVVEALCDGGIMEEVSVHTINECNKKLEGKNLLLDNPESRLKTKKKGDQQKKYKNSKERRLLDKELLKTITFDSIVPLHMLWLEYMRDIISTTTNQSLLLNSLLRADYHGSIIRVVQSKSPCYVGIEGIVCKESMNSFIIVRRGGTATVPKRGNVFECVIPSESGGVNGRKITFHLYGDQLAQHSALRSTKKYKARHSIALS